MRSRNQEHRSANSRSDAKESAADVARPISISSVPDDENQVLRSLVEGTVAATGEQFFQSLVQNLATATGAQFAFVAEFAGDSSTVRTIAMWGDGGVRDNVEWSLPGTPCEEVIGGCLCHHPRGVAAMFPNDKPLVELGIESYLGVPLVDRQGITMGHLAVFDRRPMPDEPRRLSVFQIFAARAAAELERVRMERRIQESEQRYRDLFDEAPIGYVYEDTDTRFVSANRAAQQILGIKPEEVQGTVGLSLVAPTPQTQQRVHESLASEQAGRERPYIEIELRRKDNGKPVWVQRWSRPEPDGRHTRTMIIDITDRVLAEQERNRLHQQNQYLRDEIKNEHNFDEIIGSSPALADCLARVKQVAPTDSTVLILGETGTGKELIARAIHNTSRRRDKPLIKLNCSALPTGLIESELFGHEKGAFTGALEKRIGRFSLADGGTIFLDEIGDIPHDVQVRLLRVLQEREFEPVGSPKTIKVDVRVIAATNRDLQKTVNDGAFRSDLFYRLNVFPIQLPALRERAQDIPMLAHYFISKYAGRIGKPVRAISDKAMQLLSQYHWPGNIRELENIIERAVIVSAGDVIEKDAIMLGSSSGALPRGETTSIERTPVATAAENEKRNMLRALEQSRWVIEGDSGAAKTLGLHPNTLRSRMKKLGLKRGNDIS